MNLRLKAESAAASAEDKATHLEGKLSYLSDSIEREKTHLNSELAQLKRESKFCVSKISADVSKIIQIVYSGLISFYPYVINIRKPFKKFNFGFYL